MTGIRAHPGIGVIRESAQGRHECLQDRRVDMGLEDHAGSDAHVDARLGVPHDGQQTCEAVRLCGDQFQDLIEPTGFQQVMKGIAHVIR